MEQTFYKFIQCNKIFQAKFNFAEVKNATQKHIGGNTCCKTQVLITGFGPISFTRSLQPCVIFYLQLCFSGIYRLINTKYIPEGEYFWETVTCEQTSKKNYSSELVDIRRSHLVSQSHRPDFSDLHYQDPAQARIVPIGV